MYRRLQLYQNVQRRLFAMCPQPTASVIPGDSRKLSIQHVFPTTTPFLDLRSIQFFSDSAAEEVSTEIKLGVPSTAETEAPTGTEEERKKSKSKSDQYYYRRRRARAAARKRSREIEQRKVAKTQQRKGKLAESAIARVKHTEEDFQRLFDDIAPHETLDQVDGLMKKLNKLTKRQNRGARTIPFSTDLLGILKRPGFRRNLLDFIMPETKGQPNLEGPFKDPPSDMKADSPETKKPPNQKGLTEDPPSDMKTESKHFEKILLAARERGLQNQLCWNDKEARKMSELSRKEAQKIRTEKLDRHTKDQKQQEVSSLASYLMSVLHQQNVASFCDILEGYVGFEKTKSESAITLGDKEGEMSTKKKSGIRKRMRSIRRLSAHLYKATGVAHYHLVAPKVADFFLMGSDVVKTDSRFQHSVKKWKSSKRRFVTTMMKVQEALQLSKVDDPVEAEGGALQPDREDDPLEAEGGVLQPHREDDPLEAEGEAYQPAKEDISVEAERDLEADASRPSDDSTDSSSIAEDIEMNLSGLNVLPEEKKRKRTKQKHISFEAMPIMHISNPVETIQNGHAASSEDSALNSQQRNMVFIDNLPIAINESDIKDLYGRLGEISSIEIFNQRPDLDPGELSRVERANRRKRQIQSVSTRFKRWRRPCTPVYGLITFVDEKGCQKASEASLRIFGMLIRKHPVRSICTSDMTNLFVEGIPDGHPCVDFEHQLGQVLDPDVFVSLASGQNNRAMVGSCEIKFPSFALAYASSLTLKKLDIVQDDGTDCRINWMRTPKNAKDWWTRNLCFY